MVILGVDYGEKRVGLAIATPNSSPERMAVIPGGDEAVDGVVKAVLAHEVGTVVVGLPRNLDGDDTTQTRLVRQFATRLEAELGGIPVVLQDEADTSNIARGRLTRQKMSDKEIKQWLDAEAAAVILEDFKR